MKSSSGLSTFVRLRGELCVKKKNVSIGSLSSALALATTNQTNTVGGLVTFVTAKQDGKNRPICHQDLPSV